MFFETITAKMKKVENPPVNQKEPLTTLQNCRLENGHFTADS